MASFRESSSERLASYCTAQSLALSRRLGFGKDGTVWFTSRNTAVKVFERDFAYSREREVYRRLANLGIDGVAGHTVPELLRSDDILGIIEMSIVEPPFVLDFASAQLDHPFDFPDDVLSEWFAEKREQFGADWSKAVVVLRALERMGIYMTDVHPGNIKFR